MRRRPPLYCLLGLLPALLGAAPPVAPLRKVEARLVEGKFGKAVRFAFDRDARETVLRAIEAAGR